MKKYIISVFLSIIFIISLAITPANAYTLSSDVTIHADAVLLKNIEADMVIYEKNADKVVYPASITKLMTALVVVENVPDLDVMITAGENVVNDLLGTGASILLLEPGEQMSAANLLYGLLVSSGCDAANVLAEYVSGSVSAFVDKMNEKAAVLGMNNTHFVNAHGLHDDNHYTTARDLEKLGMAVMKSEFLLKVCSTSRYTIPATNMSKERYLATTNLMMDGSSSWFYKRVKGLKTGFTDPAGRCLMSLAEKDGEQYLCIVLGCDPYDEKGNPIRNDFNNTKDLLYWAYTDFEYAKIAEKGSPAGEVKLKLCSKKDFVLAVLEEDFYSVVPKESESSVIIEPHFEKDTVKAPIKQGQVLGYAIIYCAGEELGRVNLVSPEAYKKSTILAILDVIKKIKLD